MDEWPIGRECHNLARAETAPLPLDVERIRADFPLLSRTVHGKPLIYFDSANTSQKPVSVIEAVDRHYREHNANVARSLNLGDMEMFSAWCGADQSRVNTSEKLFAGIATISCSASS